ncbi:MAG: hypothetical protein ABIO81_12040, partial [Ginsengibacter sp.]
MRAGFIYLICLISSTSSAQKSDTIFHSVVSNGFITGEQKRWKENKNEYHYTYYINDRGRGDSVNETVFTNDDGQVISATESGVDYYKSPYSASYS